MEIYGFDKHRIRICSVSINMLTQLRLTTKKKGENKHATKV